MICGKKLEMSKTVSMAQVLDAMELGGYKQGFAHLVESDSQEGKEVGFVLNADAIGQAALNLGIDDGKLAEWLDETMFSRYAGCKDHPESKLDSVYLYIVHLNDYHEEPPYKIATHIRRKFKGRLTDSHKFEPFEWHNTNYQGVRV